MGFMDNVSAFTKGVSQKAKGNYDVFAINNQISNVEREMQQVYQYLGQAYFNLHKDNAEPDLQSYIETIIQKQNQVAELRRTAEATKAQTDAVSLVPPQQPQQPQFNGQQFNGQQFNGQPQFNGQAPMGQPQFNGQAPMGQPQFNGQAPMGQPQFGGQAPMGQPQFAGQAPQMQPVQNAGPVCSNCGTPLREGAAFCTGCGQPVAAPQAPVAEAAPAQEAPVVENAAPEAPAEETPVETTTEATEATSETQATE
jgi:hypothetical protein